MDKDRNPETHTTIITVDDDGNFTYVKPMIFANREDTIIWECKNSCPFAVHFGKKTPMKSSYQSVDGTPIQDTVPLDAQYGAYIYMVAVYKDGKIWTDDPPFIVKPG